MIDADGLNLLCRHKGLIQGYKDAVITPNQVEFKRLWQTQFNTEAPDLGFEGQENVWEGTGDVRVKPAEELALAMGVNVFLKGKVDVISDGTRTICVGVPGSEKRCGGQGDILSGVIATTFWNAKRNSCDVLNAFALAAVIVRKSAAMAFRKKQRGLSAPDVIKALPKALIDVIGTCNL